MEILNQFITEHRIVRTRCGLFVADLLKELYIKESYEDYVAQYYKEMQTYHDERERRLRVGFATRISIRYQMVGYGSSRVAVWHGTM